VGHAGGRDVVDECSLAECQCRPLVLGQMGPHTAGGRVGACGFAASDLGEQLDGVDDLLVAGAAAEVGSHVGGDLRASGAGVALQKGVCPDGQSRRAEAALDGAASNEAIGDLLAVDLGETFERGDAFAGDLRGFDRAGEAGLVVDEDGAGAALTLGLTASLGRGDAEVVAQGVEQGLVANLDAGLLAVDREGDVRGGRPFGHGMESSCTNGLAG